MPEMSELPALVRPVPLWLDDISVSFDGFRALDHLTLQFEPGELRCIIGPNGAGKSTMMDVITGKTKPDAGHVYLDGRMVDLTQLDEVAIARLGVCRKFQRPTVFESLTVYENLELACFGDKRAWASLLRSSTGAQRSVIEAVLVQVGLTDEAAGPAGLLSHGQKQWLEIGMLLVQKPRVLLVDEPVAGMTPAEVERTAALLVSLADARTVVVVEHDMEFVRSIARKVTVLHEGRVLAEGSMKAVQEHPQVAAVYLGA